MPDIYTKYERLRDDFGVTNFTVAKKTGISNGSFDSWKKRETKPSAANLLKLADYFGVSVDYFLKE